MRQSYWNNYSRDTVPLSKPPCISTTCTYTCKHIAGTVYAHIYNLGSRRIWHFQFCSHCRVVEVIQSHGEHAARVRSRFAESALSSTCTWKIVGLSYARADFYKFTCHFGERVMCGFPILLYILYPFVEWNMRLDFGIFCSCLYLSHYRNDPFCNFLFLFVNLLFVFSLSAQKPLILVSS